MNLWLESLPDYVEVDGIRYKINTDFRVWVHFENLLFWSNESMDMRVAALICLGYVDEMPDNIYTALNALIEFYNSNGSTKIEDKTHNEAPEQTAPNARIYSFNHDASLIYAAFKSQYNINLDTAMMHWWQFQSLFFGLNDDNKICRIMEIRAMDLSSIKDKDQKAHYRRMKRVYRLPDIRTDDEKEAAMIDAFAGMF